MTSVPKLTTVVACRVARMHRDRFNEYVAAGQYNCAPATIPGRARLFDPDDMIALWLFRELMDDGLNPATAGAIACAVGKAARQNPEAGQIAYIQKYMWPDGGIAMVYPVVNHGWQPNDGEEIRKMTVFNIETVRRKIAFRTEEERSIIGPDD